MQNNREKKSFRVLAILEAKSESRQELLEFLISLVVPAREEQGNVYYDLHYSTKNPNEFLLDELWDTKDDFDRHYESSKSSNDRMRVSRLLVKPLEIKTYVNLS